MASTTIRKTSFRKVTHAIFDMDGLLIDTEGLYTEATQNILNDFGKTYTWDVKCTVMGLTGREVAQKLVAYYELPITWEEFVDRSRAQYRRLFPRAQLMPDTEGAYMLSITNVLARLGKKYTPEMRAKVLGCKTIDTSKVLVRELALSTSPNDFFQILQKELFKHVTNRPLMPGAERLVRHLHDKQIPCAVATSSTQDSFDLKTAKHQDFFKLFHHLVVGGSDKEVKNGKPAPDIFQICASRFEDKPSFDQCLVFEDAPNGVTGAIAAGMQCVMVPDAEIDPKLTTHATLVLKSLTEFQPELFGLPPFPK